MQTLLTLPPSFLLPLRLRISPASFSFSAASQERAYGTKQLRRTPARKRLADDIRPKSNRESSQKWGFAPRTERTGEERYPGRSHGPDSNSGSSKLLRRNFGITQDFRGQTTEDIDSLLDSEFDNTHSQSPSEKGKLTHLPESFASPPLMPGLLDSVRSMLGEDPKPMPIQALSMKHLFSTGPMEGEGDTYKQFLLASETGSGKSLAYLLPLLQHLKESELRGTSHSSTSNLMSPRALVLAPTHELARQLAATAKGLVHNIKLRVLCASRANVRNRQSGVGSGTARGMKDALAAFDSELAKGNEGIDGEVEIEMKYANRDRPVDALVGTPMKVLEMVRGRWWDDDGERDAEGRRKEKGRPEMALANVEYVVVDEADVLFDPDFLEYTQHILNDIKSARLHIPVSPETGALPFHLTLTSATIPASLSTYLTKHNPSLTRLASPGLHRLPSTLRTEHATWSGGSRNSDIEKRLRRVWAEDALRGPDENGRKRKSKVLLFCNKNSKVQELGRYLTEKGIVNVALTSASAARHHGSNKHLEGFLKLPSSPQQNANTAPNSSQDDPHVLITTSLLSRGLDFSPACAHVFVVEPPRNMVDFLHRAGRAGRAGAPGKVVVFGRMKGKGSGVAKEIRKKVGALTGR